MQDSNITFRFAAQGIPEIRAEADKLGVTLTNLTRQANGSYTAAGKLSTTLDEQAAATQRAKNATAAASKAQSSYIGHIAKTTILSAAVNKAFLGIADAAGDAVTQVDLFQNFPASMAALGLSSSDASASLLKLRDYAAQTGISLTEATQTVTRFAEITKNVKAATAEFVGVKNALIAGGAPAQQQANALEQLTQAYARGKPQLIEFRSLQTAMPAQLTAVAKALNLPNTQALGESLTAGTISMQTFITTLTKLGTGTGEIAKQAQARMSGIAFSAGVMKNALTNGIAQIVQAIGRQNIVSFFTFLTQVIIVTAQAVVKLINVLISLFNFISGIFGGPQLGHFAGDAAQASDALQDGADGAKDISDGLGDAADSANKITKSLASFDKMNVLADKTSDSGSGKDKGGGVAGQNGIDPDTAKGLDDIFGNIGGKLGEASTAAKVFAGVLGGLVLAKPLVNLVTALSDVAKGFKDGATGADTFGKKVGGIGKIFKDTFSGKSGDDEATKKGAGFGYSIISGLAGVLGSSAGKLWKILLAPLIGIVVDALALIGAIVIEALIAIGVLTGAVALPFIALVAIGAVIVAAIVALFYVIYKNWDTIWDAIKTVASVAWKYIQKGWDGVTDFFVAIWHGIYNGVKAAINGIKDAFNAVVDFVKDHATLFEIMFAPLIFIAALVILTVAGIVAFFKFAFDSIVSIFSGAPGFFSGIFSAAFDFIKAVWDTVAGFFQGVWDAIVGIFTAVTGFFSKVFSEAWEAIKAVWMTVSTWFNTNVIQPVIVFFTPLTNFLSQVFSKAWDAIKAVWNAVAGYFSQVWTGITMIFGAVEGFFRDRFVNAYNNITGVFSSLYNWFNQNVWQPIVRLFTSVGTTVGDALGGAFKGAMNGVFSGVESIVNTFLGLLRNAVNVINKLPGVNLPTSGLASIKLPRLAKGGVVDQATMAIIGEQGKEAVMPLENNTEWIDTLASKLNNKQNTGDPIQVIVQIGEDKIASKVIELINEKTQMSGRNTIMV